MKRISKAEASDAVDLLLCAERKLRGADLSENVGRTITEKALVQSLKDSQKAREWVEAAREILSLYLHPPSDPTDLFWDQIEGALSSARENLQRCLRESGEKHD